MTLLLREADVERVIQLDLVIAAVESAMRELAPAWRRTSLGGGLSPRAGC